MKFKIFGAVVVLTYMAFIIYWYLHGQQDHLLQYTQPWSGLLVLSTWLIIHSPLDSLVNHMNELLVLCGAANSIIVLLVCVGLDYAYSGKR